MSHAEYTEWETLVKREIAAGYLAAPAPSLCDICRCAHLMVGGTAGPVRKQYAQRYCARYHKAIHEGGPQECVGYELAIAPTP